MKRFDMLGPKTSYNYCKITIYFAVLFRAGLLLLLRFLEQIEGPQPSFLTKHPVTSSYQSALNDCAHYLSTIQSSSSFGSKISSAGVFSNLTQSSITTFLLEVAAQQHGKKPRKLFSKVHLLVVAPSS
jgi:hypothetical protein